MYEFIFWNFIKVSLPVFILCGLNRVRSWLSPLLCLGVIIIYLLAMYRSSGVDIENYRRIFSLGGEGREYDFIFSLLNYIFVNIGISFEAFLLIIGIVNLILIYKISNFYNISIGVVLFLFLLHLFIVRDFSQLRIGLACNIIIYSFTLEGRWRYILALIACGLHLTAGYLFFILWFLSGRSSTGLLQDRRFYVALAFVILLGLFIQQLSILDPRIDIYLSWQKEGYGMQVHSFLQSLFIGLLLIINLRLNEDQAFKNFMTKNYILALATFISFSGVAIFAYRLTNVALSLYPFAVAFAFKHSRAGFEKILFAVLLAFILLTRSNSRAIISDIGIFL